MTTYRCPHATTGRISWPLSWPPPGGPCARVDVCDSDACHSTALRHVEEITGHSGEYVPYPVKTSGRRLSRSKLSAPRAKSSRARTAAVPWDVLGALLVAAPVELEEWAEERLGAAVVAQAIKAAKAARVTEINA